LGIFLSVSTLGLCFRPTMAAGGFCRLLGLWLYESSAGCIDAIDIPWTMSDAFDWLKSVEGMSY
jgi:hypothetical protein